MNPPPGLPCPYREQFFVCISLEPTLNRFDPKIYNIEKGLKKYFYISC